MAGFMVMSAAMGAMHPLLAKLNTLMGDEYKKFKELRKETFFLKCELSAMHALLEKMDDADELDPLAKNWRKDIIDMSYDIEDYLDDFMHRVDEANSKVGILQKASHLVRTIKDRYRIANQAQEIKTRVIQASNRRMRYKVDECISSTTFVSIDPRLSALYKESNNLVGIHRQKEDLIEWVMDEEEQLKVLSIVGSGGSGKTTLANQVYSEIREQFNCNTFVSISQKPDITGLLNRVLSQFHLPLPSYAWELQDLVNILGRYLQDKRYFIVVDDLWDVRAWNIISCAFPQNNQRSRVIVTTRIEDVARACCSGHGRIHIMKPLSDQDARNLFLKRVFGSEDDCPLQFIDVLCEILKTCDGLPLAVITVASILASQPARIKEQWEYIKNSLAPHSSINSTLEDMMHILDLSYKNLPHRLRACFLYLGTYPEDCEIRRDDLIRKWVAEGFVSNSPGWDAWDVAKIYFNELINRSMIQPTYDDLDVEVVSCRVHDMMLDLILRKGTEDNFFSVLHDRQAVAGVQGKVRRLSLNLSSAKDGTMPMTKVNHLSQVRSLAIFGGLQCIPPLQDFKLLRVLALDFSWLVTNIDLTSMVQLSQLRYLKVECNAWSPGYRKRCILLPNRIGRLRHLETMELPKASSCSIPEDMVDLLHLSHLVLPVGTTRFSDGIGKLKSLRTLVGFSLPKNSLENTKDLSELTNLEVLELIISPEVHWNTTLASSDGDMTAESAWMAALCSSLGKLANLKRLYMNSYSEILCGDALSSLSPPFHKLERLDLSGLSFFRVPKWIGDLHNLCRLELASKSICSEDVGIIGMLPSLVELILQISGILTERIEIASTGFAMLKHLLLDCDAQLYLTFGVGAMPKLSKLTLTFDQDEWDKATPVGLQHLSRLTQIEIWRALYFDVLYERDNIAEEMIRGVFQDAVDALPCRPALIVHKGCIRRPRG